MSLVLLLLGGFTAPIERRTRQGGRGRDGIVVDSGDWMGIVVPRDQGKHQGGLRGFGRRRQGDKVDLFGTLRGSMVRHIPGGMLLEELGLHLRHRQGGL